MENNKKLELKEIGEILNSKQQIKFIIDTNVIISYLNSSNQFHLEALTSIDALIVKKAYFIIPYLVVGEFISHRSLLKRGNVSIKKALDFFNQFREKVKRVLTGGPSLNFEKVISQYARYSRSRKLTDAGFVDFMILTQAEEINNVRILTCDKKMVDCGRTIFKDKIYYLPNKSKDINSDYPRLMKEIQDDFR